MKVKDYLANALPQELFLFCVVNLSGTTRSRIGEEMQTALMISSQVSHEVRDSFHWLLSCWSQSSWIPSSILPQLCLPFSAKPILANCLDNPALGGCLPALCSLLPTLWWGGCSKPGVAASAAGTVLVLQCPGHLWWIQNTNHLRNPEFGVRNHYSVKEVKNIWFILCNSSERSVSDSQQILGFFLKDAHRAYNNGTI